MFFLDRDGREYDEDGNPRSQALQPCQHWADSKEAAAILCMAQNSFHGIARPGNNYFEIRRKLRGFAGKKSARGQGQLFNKSDLRRIVHIKKAMGCGMVMAARIFAAQRKNLI